MKPTVVRRTENDFENRATSLRLEPVFSSDGKNLRVCATIRFNEPLVFSQEEADEKNFASSLREKLRAVYELNRPWEGLPEAPKTQEKASLGGDLQ